MIWALLAVLGVPLWLLAVLLVAVFRNRRKVLARTDIFRFVTKTDNGWSRSAGVARWVSDVLIVHKGPALVNTDAAQVVSVDVRGQVDTPIKKLDGDDIELTWEFADSESKRVAVSRSDLPTATR